MAYKFVKSRQLKELLNGAELKQKQDIHDFSGGHLNESLLLQHYTAATRKSWDGAQHRESLLEQSQVIPSPPAAHRPPMEQALFEFSMGTSGVVPNFPHKKGCQSPLKKYKFLREKTEEVNNEVESPSNHSLFSELEDGILVEELPSSELMMKKVKKSPALPKLKPEVGMLNGEASMFTTQSSFLGHQPRHLLHDLPFNYNFMTMHGLGVTRQDQYRKMRTFEASMLKKKEASEQNVLSGVKAVEHLEKKLQEELEVLNLQGLGINFHKLQVYSNTLEDLINDSPTFSYILRCIKAEYDNYIAWLLDHQTSQQHLLREQVEQMAVRGTSRPQEMEKAMENVSQLEEEAQSALALNQRLRDEVSKEKEWLENTPEPSTDNAPKNRSIRQKDQPLELAEEIENLKAIILEKIDEENAMRVRLREKFVPMTVCTHLEQCIKETEVEVQKLLKQNEYYERSIDEMETELKEAIHDADTSEKDARRIWRKVNSTRGMPGHPHPPSGHRDSDDEEEEEESKWNWYIS